MVKEQSLREDKKIFLVLIIKVLARKRKNLIRDNFQLNWMVQIKWENFKTIIYNCIKIKKIASDRDIIE